MTNLPALQSAASGINAQDLLSVISIIQALPTGVTPTTLLADPSSLLTALQGIVPNVQNPSAGGALFLLDALNLGGLGDLTSALPAVSGAASGSGAAGLTSALTGLTAAVGGSAGVAAGR